MSAADLYVALANGRFRVERRWGDALRGQDLGRISTIAATADGSLLVAQRTGAPVLVLATDGRVRDAWETCPAVDPHGIRVGPAGRVLLVDRDAHEVLVLDNGGRITARLGRRGHPRFQAPFNHPTSAAMADDGEIYVADGYGNASVHRFSADGAHLATWGAPGADEGQFSTPHAIWIDRAQRVLVVDRENDRVQIFTRDGDFIASWAGFHKPMDVCETPEGHFLVSDQIPRLSQLDTRGELIARCRPVWNVPHGIACAPDGTIYVTDMNPNSITRLVPAPD